MTSEEENYLVIRGTIADLPEKERLEVEDIYSIIKKMSEERPLTVMAIALIGAELAK